MSAKFKAGDRVKVFGANTQGGEITGTVKAIRNTGWPLVEHDGGLCTSATYHPKQCRLLKKKARRRVWITNDAMEMFKATFLPKDKGIEDVLSFKPREGWNEFIETKRRAK